MNASFSLKFALLLAGVPALIVLPARADLFGSGANTFTLDFVDIGNLGNADDAGAGGSLWGVPESSQRSSFCGVNVLTNPFEGLGFRVASVPEPSAAMLMLGSGLMWLARRRRGSSL